MQTIAPPITIAIAEDQPLALKAILRKLGNSIGLNILYTACNGLQLLEKLNEHPADIVLMDIAMPIMDGIITTSLLTEKHPATKVLIMTTFDDDDKIFEAILAGASGYLLKDEKPEVVKKAIYDIYHGGAAMSATIALKALNHIRSTEPNTKAPSPKTTSLLSPRETEILTALRDGMAYKQIADSFFISEGTVRKHIEHIYRKLQVNNKVSAVNVASKNQWL